MNKRKISLLLILFLILSIPKPSYADAQDYYTSKDRLLVNNALEEISRQSFNSAMTTNRAKLFMHHFISNTTRYEKVSNAHYPRSQGSDGTYSSNYLPSQGCLHYAEFVSNTMYGYSPDQIYPEEETGRITEKGIKKFIQRQAQAGEHMRIDYIHSLIFISSDDSGFYTLQYYGDNEDPFFSYWTYKDFANRLNYLGSDFWIYNSDNSINGSKQTNK